MVNNRKNRGRKTAISSRRRTDVSGNFSNRENRITAENLAQAINEDPSLGNILREVMLNYNVRHDGVLAFSDTENMLEDFKNKPREVQSFFIYELTKTRDERQYSASNFIQKEPSGSGQPKQYKHNDYSDDSYYPPMTEEPPADDFFESLPENVLELSRRLNEEEEEKTRLEEVRKQLEHGIDVPFNVTQRNPEAAVEAVEEPSQTADLPEEKQPEQSNASVAETSKNGENFEIDIDEKVPQTTSGNDAIMRDNFGYSGSGHIKLASDQTDQFSQSGNVKNKGIARFAKRLKTAAELVKEKMSELCDSIQDTVYGLVGYKDQPEFMRNKKAVDALGMKSAYNEKGQRITTPTGKVLYNNAEKIENVGTSNSCIKERDYQGSNLFMIVADVHCYGERACQNSEHLNNVNFMHTEIIEAGAFAHTALSGTIECPSALQIDATAFNGCTGVKELRTFYGTRFVGNSMLPPWIKLCTFNTDQSPVSLRTTDVTGRSQYEIERIPGIQKGKDGEYFYDIAGRRIEVTSNAPAYKSLSLISLKSSYSKNGSIAPKEYRKSAIQDVTKALQNYYQNSVNIIQKDQPSMDELGLTLIYFETSKSEQNETSKIRHQEVVNSVNLLAQLYPDDYNDLISSKNKQLAKMYNLLSRQREETAKAGANSQGGKKRFMFLHLKATDSYVMFGKDAENYAKAHALEQYLVNLPGTQGPCLYLQCNVNSNYYKTQMPQIVSLLSDENLDIIDAGKRFTARGMMADAYGKSRTMQSIQDMMLAEETREQKLLSHADEAAKIIFQYCDARLENGIDENYIRSSLTNFDQTPNAQQTLSRMMNYISEQTKGIKDNTPAAAEIQTFFTAIRSIAPKSVKFNDPSFDKTAPTYKANIYDFDGKHMVISRVAQNNATIRFGQDLEHTLIAPMSCITVKEDGRAANLFVMGSNSKKVSYILDGKFSDSSELNQVLSSCGINKKHGSYRLEGGKEMISENQILSEYTFLINRLNASDQPSRSDSGASKESDQTAQQHPAKPVDESVAPVGAHIAFATNVEQAKSLEYTPSTDTFHVVFDSKKTTDDVKRYISDESKSKHVYIDVTEQVKDKIATSGDEQLVISVNNLKILQWDETGFSFKADDIKGATSETDNALMFCRSSEKGASIFKKTDRNDQPILLRDLFARPAKTNSERYQNQTEQHIYTLVNSR